jgi:hypothetical protein
MGLMPQAWVENAIQVLDLSRFGDAQPLAYQVSLLRWFALFSLDHPTVHQSALWFAEEFDISLEVA